MFYELLKAPGKKRKHISARTVCHVAGVVRVAHKKDWMLSNRYRAMQGLGFQPDAPELAPRSW